MNRKAYKYLVFVMLALAVVLSGCYKELLPKEKDHFSDNAAFDKDTYLANIGRTNVFIANFNPDYSTQPLTFEIQNIQHADGSPAPELLEQVNTWQWKKYYSGTEKSIEEIYAKREPEKRPVLDIREHSGDLIFWNTDSSKIKPGIYTFDILVKNNGGQKLFQKRKLDLRRPRPYDPYEFWDDTGEQKEEKDGGVIHPEIIGVRDDLNNEVKREDINVYFRKTTIPGNTVSFKFFDKDSLPLKLSLFNLMKWDSLTYRSNTVDGKIYFGFNRKMSEDSTVVSFDIPNPFPVLADVAGGDEKAAISFMYERVAFGLRTQAAISLGFAIFEPGSWEVIFKCKTNPRFAND
ncbi:DUF5007 domain-containing protein [Chitinophaga sp. MM2321]|uniref:DUF5007 domain-containing protein n=1 Tax=Chitinophaga sp. MM2321 TaxID=3137178 RepID=UPI0032D5956A